MIRKSDNFSYSIKKLYCTCLMHKINAIRSKTARGLAAFPIACTWQSI